MMRHARRGAYWTILAIFAVAALILSYHTTRWIYNAFGQWVSMAIWLFLLFTFMSYLRSWQVGEGEPHHAMLGWH